MLTQAIDVQEGKLINMAALFLNNSNNDNNKEIIKS